MDLDKLQQVLIQLQITVKKISNGTDKLELVADKLKLEKLASSVNQLLTTTENITKVIDEETRHALGKFENEADNTIALMKKARYMNFKGMLGFSVAIGIILTFLLSYTAYRTVISHELNRIENSTHSEIILSRLIENNIIERMESTQDGLVSYIIMNQEPDVQVLENNKIAVILDNKR